MLNLNYNINRAVGGAPNAQPTFAPYGRPDPFSASLVLAIPGAIFKNGYNNVFNQINEFDDISGYLKGGAVLDVNTGRYVPAYPSHEVTPTGSVGFITGSATLNNFTSSGYNTALIVSGNTSLTVTPFTASLGDDFNLSKEVPWCMETWVAYNTGSFIYYTEDPFAPGFQASWGQPNKQFVGRWYSEDTASINPSYISYLGLSGFIGAIPQAEPYVTASGIPAFYYGNQGGDAKFRVTAPYDNNIVPLQWQHTAITCYPTGSSPSGSIGVVSLYINGQKIGGANITEEIPFTPNKLITILGNAEPYTGSDEPGYINNSNYTTGSGLYIQDMRVYNGAAKYTGSSFTPPLSMIVGENEPYPQFQ